MDDLTGYIPYRKAKWNLDNRLQTSDDEIALWVSGVAGFGLDAYMIGFRGKLISFLENGSHPFGGDDYISPLEGLHFLPTDVEQFKPDKRFIPWRMLVERWGKYYEGDKDRTVNFINHRRKDSGLFEYHPVTGSVESLDGELFERGLFDLTVVEAIEHAHLFKWDMPYSDAKRILQEKFNATEQEIVHWMLDEEITPEGMWGLINIGGKEKKVCLYGIDSYEYTGEMHRLQNLDFNADEIKHFAPKNRWLTFNQVMERWPESEESIEMRQQCVAEKLKTNMLPFPKIDGIDKDKNLNLYIYHLSDIERIFPLQNSQKLSTEPQAETAEINGEDSQADTIPTSVTNREKKQRTRKTNLSRAVDAAIKKIGRKPSFDELWQFFQDDKDETDFIHDYTDTHLTWIDTKGNFHDTKKETLANHLSRIKS